MVKMPVKQRQKFTKIAVINPGRGTISKQNFLPVMGGFLIVVSFVISLFALKKSWTKIPDSSLPSVSSNGPAFVFFDAKALKTANRKVCYKPFSRNDQNLFSGLDFYVKNGITLDGVLREDAKFPFSVDYFLNFDPNNLRNGYTVKEFTPTAKDKITFQNLSQVDATEKNIESISLRKAVEFGYLYSNMLLSLDSGDIPFFMNNGLLPQPKFYKITAVPNEDLKVFDKSS